MLKRRYFTWIAFTIGILSTPLVLASMLDRQVLDMTSQAKHTAAGQTLYETVCASCHNKDLSGATGFNLKDGEWIHGSQPSDIIKNIKNGFAKAGMPGFASMYSEQQIKQIAAYILSKREGWDNLTYELYQLDKDADFSFNAIQGKTPIKTGSLVSNLADYEIPELSNYALIFKGDFYTPKEKNAKLSSNNPGYILLDASIDGAAPQVIKKKSLPLKKGKQSLVVRMMTLNKRVFVKHKKSPRTNVSLMITGKNERKLFPASTRAVSAMTANKLEINAKSEPVVQRKKVLDLPPFSIVVGLPEKINYAFNPKNCAISGAWTGDLLNIGPNVKNRGNDHSLILGKWLFHSPQSIAPVINQNCRFDEYTRLGNPKFYFTLDKVKYSVEAFANDSQSFDLLYKVVANPNQIKSLTLTLPQKTKVSSKDGLQSSNTLTFDLTEKQHFRITVGS
jgi:cytochrome c553